MTEIIVDDLTDELNKFDLSKYKSDIDKIHTENKGKIYHFTLGPFNINNINMTNINKIK